MNLNRYLILEEEHTLSSDEVQALNADISAKGLSDIPEKHRERVADYIVAALNMGTVEPDLVPSIEGLPVSYTHLTLPTSDLV